MQTDMQTGAAGLAADVTAAPAAVEHPSAAAMARIRELLGGSPEMAELGREAYQSVGLDVLQECGALAGVRVLSDEAAANGHRSRRPFSDIPPGEVQLLGRCAAMLVIRGEHSPGPLAELRRLRLLAYL